MEKNVQITIDVPDGYEFIAYRKATYGDKYKSHLDGTIQTWNNQSCDSFIKVFVFKEKALTMVDTKIGDMFKFKKDFPNRIFRKVGNCSRHFIICNVTGYTESFSDYDYLKEIELVK